jgi:hypothetical protein
MARKTKKRRSGMFARKTTRRRRPSPIGRIMKRRSSPSRGGMQTSIMDAVTVGAGLVAGQYLGKMLADKVEALSDAKIRGAALAALGIFGGKFLPPGMRGIALGVAASGVYQVAKEVLPAGTIAGDDSLGQLSPADVELIENMALESEMTGFDSDLRSTMTGSMDADVMSTVTGTGDDDDDDSDDSDY